MPVTGLAVNQDFSCIALGFSNGFILLYYGEPAKYGIAKFFELQQQQLSIICVEENYSTSCSRA